MIKFTLHDIFGYLLPGTIVLLAAGTLLCAVHPPTAISVLLLTENHWLLLVLLLLFAYSLGHIVAELSRKVMPCQGFGKFLSAPFSHRLSESVKAILCQNSRITEKEEPLRESRYVRRIQETIYKPFCTWCGRLLRSSDKAEQEGEDIRERTCDEYIIQFGGKTYRDTRDLFYHRIDYYRGTSLSLAVLFLSALVSLALGGLRILMGWTYPAVVDTSLLVWVPAALLGFSTVGCWTSYQRFCRFEELRVQLIAINFLLLQHDKEQREKASDARVHRVRIEK